MRPELFVARPAGADAERDVEATSAEGGEPASVMSSAASWMRRTSRLVSPRVFGFMGASDLSTPPSRLAGAGADGRCLLGR